MRVCRPEGQTLSQLQLFLLAKMRIKTKACLWGQPDPAPCPHVVHPQVPEIRQNIRDKTASTKTIL